MSSNETADEVFGRIVTAGLSVKSGGDVDSATGLFSLVEIPENSTARAELRYSVITGNPKDADVFDGLGAGWYVVTLRSGDGAFYYPCESKEAACNEFNDIQGYFDSFEEMGWGY